ncbi:hypothetical protein M422DRAFT_156931 [Sphaerobolus stellatus SS14]|nr:hypothetical protein M422DRAFT_156931 [Sphaerobolus stellatus SS14]
MKTFACIVPAILATLVTQTSSTNITTTVTFDTVYDNPRGELNTVSCGDSPSLMVRPNASHTFGSLPNFPLIGGAFTIKGFNNPNCGTCWALTYQNMTINVLAIDTSLEGFNIAQKALDLLTGGKAVELGRVDVVAKQVPVSGCRL